MATASGGAAGTGGGGLSAIANNTVLGNTSGAAAVPTAQTAANLITAGIIQDPANVSITGGAISGATIQGLPATFVTGIDLMFDWEYAACNFLKGKVAGLTAFKAINMGVRGIGATAAATAAILADGSKEGASYGPLTTATQLTTILTMTPKTGKWAVMYRGSQVVPAVGHNTEVGLANYGGTKDVRWGGLNGKSAVNWALGCDDAGADYTTGTAMDTNVHDVAVTFDGTTITLWVDGVSTLTRTTAQLSGDVGMYVYCQVGTLGEMSIDRMVVGYVAR